MKNSLIMMIFTSMLSLIVACGNSDCPVKFRTFGIDNAPMIRKAKNNDDGCEVVFDIFLNHKEQRLRGSVEVQDSILYISFYPNKDELIRLFDFKLAVGEQYDVEIFSETFTMTVKRIINTKMPTRIFSMKGAYDFYDSKFDIIFIVNMEEGIIGSYLSNNLGDKELITNQRGDRLDAYIDYSDKEKILIK